MLSFSLFVSNPFVEMKNNILFVKDWKVTKNSSIEIQVDSFSWNLSTGASLRITGRKTMHRGVDFGRSFLGGSISFCHYDNRHRYDGVEDDYDDYDKVD